MGLVMGSIVEALKRTGVLGPLPLRHRITPGWGQTGAAAPPMMEEREKGETP